jgi:hypothetical protein
MVNKESQQIFNRALGRLKPERASGRLPQRRAFTINRSLGEVIDNGGMSAMYHRS